MKRTVALMVIFALAVLQLSSLPVLAQNTGVIQGTATGPNNTPLANVRVNIINPQGMVVGTTSTATNGAFKVTGLAPGTYTVQVVSATGAVISTTTAALAAGAMTATISVSATAAALAGAGAGAAAAGAGAAGATAAGLSTAAIVGSVAAAAGAVGVAAAVATNGDASPSR